MYYVYEKSFEYSLLFLIMAWYWINMIWIIAKVRLYLMLNYSENEVKFIHLSIFKLDRYIRPSKFNDNPNFSDIFEYSPDKYRHYSLPYKKKLQIRQMRPNPCSVHTIMHISVCLVNTVHRLPNAFNVYEFERIWVNFFFTLTIDLNSTTNDTAYAGMIVQSAQKLHIPHAHRHLAVCSTPMTD